MSLTAAQLRMARAALRLTMKDTAAKASIDVGTVVRIEAGASAYQVTLAHLRHVLEQAGLLFIDPVEGVHQGAVGLKWGVELSQRPSGSDTEAGEGKQGGSQAGAWDDGIDALHDDVEPAADPEIEEMRGYWRANPEKWGAMHASTRWALLREMQLRQL